MGWEGGEQTVDVDLPFVGVGGVGNRDDLLDLCCWDLDGVATNVLVLVFLIV